MAGARPQSLTAALDGALGAITTTRTSVKKAAAEVYTPPADQSPHPEPVPGQSAAGSA